MASRLVTESYSHLLLLISRLFSLAVTVDEGVYAENSKLNKFSQPIGITLLLNSVNFAVEEEFPASMTSIGADNFSLLN